MSRTVAFVPLTLNQTRFYVEVARHLPTHGWEAAFVSLHQPSVAYIAAAGLPVVDVYRFMPTRERSGEEQLDAAAARYGIFNVNLILSHDRVAYDVADRAYLVGKLLACLEGMEAALGELERRLGRGQPVEVVQELGGFIAVAAGFYAARRRGWNNTFIEPAFFRGRVFFIQNSFAAPRIRPAAGAEASPELRGYLEESLRENRIVIPAKDARQYRSALHKVLSARNLRRLVEKIVQKYVQRRPEEFRYIGNHVRRHLRMVTSGLRLRTHYRALDGAGPFVYFPLHVPNDMALTIRSPEYLDQFALLDYLARNVPAQYRVAVKEHPAMVGAFSPRRMVELLRYNPNVVLLDPALNNLDVIRKAAAVVTVNSKSGAEALLLDKPVFVLGDAFYRDSGLVTPISALNELPAALRTLNGTRPRASGVTESYFQTVWDRSAPGELFSSDPENCRVFAASLTQFLGTEGEE